MELRTALAVWEVVKDSLRGRALQIASVTKWASNRIQAPERTLTYLYVVKTVLLVVMIRMEESPKKTEAASCLANILHAASFLLIAASWGPSFTNALPSVITFAGRQYIHDTIYIIVNHMRYIHT